MSSYQNAIKEALRAAIADSFSLDTDAIALSDPPPDTQGEVASNIAFVLAKQLKQNPRAIAETLAAALASHAIIAHASAAGNGFINMTCTHEFWQHQLHDMIHHATWRAITIGRGSKVNVEYVSANPTGLLHIGHLRGAITGDVLANVLAFTGHEVTKEYYLNDAGGQIDVLLQSIRWHQQHPEQEQKDLYNSDEVKQFAQNCDITDDEELKQKAVHEMLSLICDELTLVGITHDVFFSEREMIAKARSMTVWRACNKAPSRTARKRSMKAFWLAPRAENLPTGKAVPSCCFAAPATAMTKIAPSSRKTAAPPILLLTLPIMRIKSLAATISSSMCGAVITVAM